MPKFEVDPAEFTVNTHPNETSISPTSLGDAIPDPHISMDEILSGMIESPYPLRMLIGPPIPPSTPSKLSTDDEYEAPEHPGMTTLYAPAEGITSSSLDPRRVTPVARDPGTLDDITPDAEDNIP